MSVSCHVSRNAPAADLTLPKHWDLLPVDFLSCRMYSWIEGIDVSFSVDWLRKKVGESVYVLGLSVKGSRRRI